RVWTHSGSPDAPGWVSSNDNEDTSGGYVEANSYFTGISIGGSLTESKEEDILTIEVRDMTEVLKSQIILNSPYFDGMSLTYAVAHLLERAGLPALKSANGSSGANQVFKVTQRARSAGVSSYRLPDSGRFT